MRLLAEDCTRFHSMLNAICGNSGVRTQSVRLTSRTSFNGCIGHVHTICFDCDRTGGRGGRARGWYKYKAVSLFRGRPICKEGSSDGHMLSMNAWVRPIFSPCALSCWLSLSFLLLNNCWITGCTAGDHLATHTRHWPALAGAIISLERQASTSSSMEATGSCTKPLSLPRSAHD